jgi:sugar lactone lactonase YvrE
VYVADFRNNRIRKITPTGLVSTLAGSGRAAYADGAGTAASFNQPFGIAVDSSGNVYVADEGNHRIRKITPLGLVTTIAGSGNPAYADGTGMAASFYDPTGVAVDAFGNVYVADVNNNRIRKLTPSNSTAVHPGIAAPTTFKVAPNPANTSLKISAPGRVSFILTNALGQSVLRDEVENEGLVDVSGLAPGVYFLSAQGYKTQQVVVQR